MCNAVPLFLTVFVACAVEAVEALTIVLAAGLTRDWRSALQGLGAALAVLAVITAVLGPALSLLPLSALRLVVGALLAAFGLQWLRKAILRYSGYKDLHDETEHLRAGDRGRPGRGSRRARLGHRLVRVHAVVQGRAARGPGGGVHRDHLRQQPA